MNFFVIGTHHRFQSRDRDPGFESLLEALIKLNFLTPLTAIAEEWHGKSGFSSAQRLSADRALRWYNVDMTTEESRKATVFAEQQNRPGMSAETITYRIPSDGVREDFWVQKLIENGEGTTLIICGYLHFESLVRKLEAKGHVVDKRVYLETVPTIEKQQSNAEDDRASAANLILPRYNRCPTH
jgi:hypothetical protein